MKRYIVILITITALNILFNACGSTAEAQYTPNENILYQADSVQSSNNNEILNLTREDFLYDLEFLVDLFKQNFPQLNHAYRKFDFNISTQAEVATAFIESLPSDADLDANLLVNILNQYIFISHSLSLAGNGVATFWGAIEYYWIIHASAYASEDSDLLQLQREALSNSISITNHEELLDRMRHLGFDISDERPMFDRPIIPIINRNITPTIQLEPIEMRLIDEEIAYLRLHMDTAIAFWGNEEAFIRYWEEHIFDFYNQIENHEHLIVDVRGERMASLDLFGQLLLGPFLENRETYLDLYGFFQGSGYSEMFARAMISPDTYIYKISNMPAIAEGHLSHLNPDDLAILDYGFRWTQVIPGGRIQSPFGGRVWILVDEDSASATEIFAKVARNEGIATLVGSQTLGNFGKMGHNGNAALVTLPNTGIIIAWDPIYFTDVYGLPLHEYYVIPDYFNYEGMDALETVLLLIRK